MLNDDGDIIRGLGFVTLYSSYLEEQIDNLLRMLHHSGNLTVNDAQRMVGQKIRKCKQILRKLQFDDYDELIAILDAAKVALEKRNKYVHGRIYSNFDRPDTLKSGRLNTPDVEITSTELYKLAAELAYLRAEVYRPMIFKIPRALASTNNIRGNF